MYALGEGDAAQEQGEDDRDEDPYEDPALGDRSADGCGALGHGLPSGEVWGGVDRGGVASPLRGRMPQAARVVVNRPDRNWFFRPQSPHQPQSFLQEKFAPNH